MSRARPSTRCVTTLGWLVAVGAAFVVACGSGSAFAQPSARLTALVEILRPALPFPEADVNGDVPVRGGEASKWFVIWPAPDDQRIVVRANPLHRDIQASGAEAMARIQEAVVAAERKAQAAYDRAIKELQQTGKASNLDGVTLEDEGVAGERIDAELELTIAVEHTASFELGSSRPPQVAPGVNGPAWSITTAANTFKDVSSTGSRDRFRPAEARLVFADSSNKPTVDRRGDRDLYGVTLVAPANSFVVVLRGNQELLAEVLAKAEWSKLSRPLP